VHWVCHFCIVSQNMAEDETSAAAEAPAAVIMSLSELASYNGISQGALVYVALDGEVYDVTSAAGMYGPGGPYNGA
jgi:Cytochrome b5-like Heme/Steroid binding domain